MNGEDTGADFNLKPKSAFKGIPSVAQPAPAPAPASAGGDTGADFGLKSKSQALREHPPAPPPAQPTQAPSSEFEQQHPYVADVGRGLAGGGVRGVEGSISAAAAGLDWAREKGRQAGEALGRTEWGKRLQKATGMTTEQAQEIYRQHPEWKPKTASEGAALINKKIEEATGGAGEKLHAQTAGGKVAERIGEYGTGALLTPGGPVGRIVRGAVAPAVGSIAGEHLGAEFGHPVIGEVAGAIAGGGLGGVLRRPGVSEDVLKASRESGIPVSVASAAESKTVQHLGKVLEKVPGAGEPLAEAAKETMARTGEVKAAAEAAAGASDREAAGAVSKERILDWHQGQKAEANRAYQALDAIMDPNARTVLTNTQAKLADLGRQAAEAGLKPSKAQKLVKTLAERPGGGSFAGIKKLRGEVGAAQRQAAIMGATPLEGEYKTLYDSLTRDLDQAALDAGGPQGLAAYKAADHQYESIMGRRRAVQSLINKKGDAAPEAVFDRTLRLASEGAGGDANKLEQVKNILHPNEWNEFAGTVSSRMGLMPDGTFSYSRWLRDQEQLSPRGRELLFKDNGLQETHAHLSALAKREKALQKFINTSGTASHNAALKAYGTAFMAPHHIPAMIAGAIGGRTMARILAQPATASMFVRVVRAGDEVTRAQMLGQNAGRAALAYRRAQSDLANAANTHLGTKLPPDLGMGATPAQGQEQQ